MKKKRIYRSNSDLIVAGVCGGLADYFEIDSSIIRIIFILLVISAGSGVWIYLILWLVLPKEAGKGKVNREKKIKELGKKAEIRAKEIAKEIRGERKIKKCGQVNILGVVLIATGGVLIWDQVFPFMINWNFFWPGLLVIIGILLLFR